MDLLFEASLFVGNSLYYAAYAASWDCFRSIVQFSFPLSFPGLRPLSPCSETSAKAQWASVQKLGVADLWSVYRLPTEHPWKWIQRIWVMSLLNVSDTFEPLIKRSWMPKNRWKAKTAVLKKCEGGEGSDGSNKQSWDRSLKFRTNSLQKLLVLKNPCEGSYDGVFLKDICDFLV